MFFIYYPNLRFHAVIRKYIFSKPNYFQFTIKGNMLAIFQSIHFSGIVRVAQLIENLQFQVIYSYNNSNTTQYHLLNAIRLWGWFSIIWMWFVAIWIVCVRWSEFEIRLSWMCIANVYLVEIITISKSGYAMYLYCNFERLG